MVPVNLFCCILRFVSFVHWPREDGIVPVNKLELTRMKNKFRKSPSCDGKLPESRLFCRFRFSIYPRLPNDVGKEPVRELPSKQSSQSDDM